METQNAVPMGQVTVSRRDKAGKGVCRRLRASGQIPAVLYGLKGEAELLQLNPSSLQKALDPAKKENTLLDLTIEGGAKGTENLKVLVKDYQIDPIKSTLRHVDFVRVALDQPLTVTIPFVTEGKPEGLIVGGVLHQVFRTLEVRCRPELIPAKIVGNVAPLKMGDTLSISQLPAPEGVTFVLPPNQTVALVTAPRKEVEVAATTTEGAAPAEGAAAAAPAEGAAKDAKAGAAAKPAAGAKAPAGDKKEKK
ncbi:MAG: 50S ribosomal protein L25 [Deltaproteobacteria bacterium]|nr:50S ribosomal protein L25 [Deltaproteobacteria bacterium]